MKKRIKPGEEQPEACPECFELAGYQVETKIKIVYCDQYNAEGELTGGFYGDSISIVTRYQNCYCTACTAKLPFYISK